MATMPASSLLFLATVLLVCSHAHATEPTVNFTTGSIRGTEFVVEGVQVDGFLGVPYAKPPVGELRFALPVPFGDVGQLTATNFSARCPQPPIGPQPPIPSSEDCLYLNVFRKSGTKQGDDKPVIVIVHGGGFSIGSASDFFYQSSPLAGLGDVVVVSFNYRLNILGFANMKELAASNVGLYDQRLALEWVQDNIKAFGGNPNRVTLMGVSAGSMAITLHIESPLHREGRQLFHSAILDGGVATLSALDDAEHSFSRVKEIAVKLGCKTEDTELIACLRKVDADELVRLSFDAEGYSPIFTFRPTTGDEFIPNNFASCASDNESDSRQIKTLIGYAKNEGTWLADYHFNLTGSNFPNLTSEEEFLDWCAKLANGYRLPIDVKADGVKKTVSETYFNSHSSRFLDAAEFVGDGIFVCPINAYVKKHAEANVTMYAYRFDRRLQQKYSYLDPDRMGVFHTSPFLHMTGSLMDAKDLLPGSPAVDAADKAFFKDAIKLVADFARTDETPSFRGVQLPNFSKGEGVLVFDEKPHVDNSLYNEDHCKKTFPTFEPQS